MGQGKKVDKWGWRWFYQQLPELTNKGILTEENAAALKAYYGEPAKKRDAVGIFIVAVGILAALLIGGGAIMILAHNWDDLPRALRVSFAYVPLLTGIGIGFFALLRDKGAAWNEGGALLISCGICASISIVAQIYQISGDTARFLLTWALLTLPLIYIFRSSATAILYMVLAVAWGFAAKDQHHDHDLWLFWLLFGAVVPHIWICLKDDKYSLRSSWLLWSWCLLFLCMSAGIVDTYNISRLWVMVCGLIVGIMYLAGRQYMTEDVSLWDKPPLFIGMGGILFLAFICSSGNFWSYFNYLYNDESANRWYVDAAVAVLMVTVYVLMMKRAIRRKAYSTLLPGGVFLVASGVWMLNFYVEEKIIPALIFNLYLLALGVMFLSAGVKEKMLFKLNGGLLIIGATIIMRFFDCHLGLLTRGIAFMLLGAVFLAVNIKVRNKWRQAANTEVGS